MSEIWAKDCCLHSVVLKMRYCRDSTVDMKHVPLCQFVPISDQCTVVIFQTVFLWRELVFMGKQTTLANLPPKQKYKPNTTLLPE